ncbi:MAG: sporulation membrane protein YtaF [Alicyclobacillus sp. RIFOXYA1_FULL_53_8]|nr:MAG: sporulation membrane protein YtaF [Alicyclobacillus sp. RIFOXYA1_FULL_53_8]
MGSELAVILAIAIASNLDNAGVGIAYGVRKIRISSVPNLVIAIISGLATYLSGYVGDILTHYVPAKMASWGAAAVMIGVGLWVMAEPLRNRRRVRRESENVVTRILRDPVQADFDKSSTIGMLEAVVLGVALAMNALVGGFDAGVLHIGILWTALMVALFSFVLLGLSAHLGSRYAADTLGAKATYVAGFLLILIGLHQVW